MTEECGHPPERVYTGWCADALHNGPWAACCACGATLVHSKHRDEECARECARLEGETREKGRAA